MNRRALIEAAVAVTGLTHTATAAPSQARRSPGSGSRATELMRKALAGVEDREVTIVEVAYPPGSSSPPHRHPGPVFGYVLEGSVVMRLDDGPEVTYRAGQTFYEAPGQLHAVSRNASKTQPARILAFLVLETGAPVLTPAKESH